MTINVPSRVQRIAAAIWPVTLTILLPVIALEAVNLWRKNRQGREINFQRSAANVRGE